MLNTSLQSSHFPDKWKIARITPISKEGCRACKKSYRPISVLPVVTRLFEKLVFDQLYSYLTINNLINWSQSAYRKLHSTTTCLIKKHCTSGIVLIDLKKALDTVDHAILCQKLEDHGLQINELLWFNSYLFNYEQFCRVRGSDSDIDNIDAGVPQRSCLGPLLFLMYITDLPKVVNASTVFMYADDTSLTFQSKGISQLNQTINDDLKHLDL